MKKGKGIRKMMYDAYKQIRKTWDIKPVTKVKGNEKKQANKKACRGKGKERD